MKATTAPVLKILENEAPVFRGILVKSFGQRIKGYRGGTVVGVLGPRAKYKRTIRDKRKGTVQKIIPSKYAHLVVKGHGGPHPAAPHDFLTPALDRSAGQWQEDMIAEVAKGIEAALTTT